MTVWTQWFEELGRDDVAQVGGKNASLGEMIQQLGGLGVQVPGGFAVTAAAYREFLSHNDLDDLLRRELDGLDVTDVEALERASRALRQAIVAGELPEALAEAVRVHYRELSRRSGVDDVHVAVRSSATAEDLPTASFAGQQESFLYVKGEAELLERVKRCFASLFTPRAIVYREHNGFEHLQVALSVGVQRMVRSDLASAGVIFTLETESGFRDLVFITSAWGLGENVVQGRVGPDAYYVHKPTLRAGFRPLVLRRRGPKELKLVYDREAHRLSNEKVSPEDRARLTLTDDEALQLARWAVTIEEHYTRAAGRDTPMDIEWAKDGETGELFIVQARPETVRSQQEGLTIRLYALQQEGEVLVEGLAVGEAIAHGKARVIKDPKQAKSFREGEVLVTEITDPDWEPILARAAGVITERGGRTSHAAIVAREMGIPAVVGAEDACDLLSGAGEVTVSCAGGDVGLVYRGALEYEVEEIDPDTLPRPERTKVMLNVADPEKAFRLAQLPCDGIGLARMEFIFASWVKVHPLALTRYDQLDEDVAHEVDELTGGYPERTEYLVDRLAQGIGCLAAAFYPRPVILRFSDFKSNEYAHLLGGAQFEPSEENPMLGWRGASRYAHPEFKDGFLLEVAAVKRVREVFGLTNLKVMIPFCRTPAEGRQVLEVLEEGGLERGKDGLEVYVMAEIPSNVLLAEQFAEVFDGFSIGSNDLTQLVLGVDRDSDRVAPLFDERNEAVRRACAMLLETAHRVGRPVGICGQAPSDYPDFAAFLVERGIDSISLTPDSLARTTRRIAEVEATQGVHAS